jgi:hypothetical protein
VSKLPNQRRCDRQLEDAKQAPATEKRHRLIGSSAHRLTDIHHRVGRELGRSQQQQQIADFLLQLRVEQGSATEF